MDWILDLIEQYGIAGFLLVVLILIIHDPERAVKLKAIFIKPFFTLFRWGSKQYIASEVGYTTSQYLRRHIARFAPSIHAPKIKIRWVTSASDPVFQSDGTLIIRLQETNDQTRNILAATRVALPRVVCSSLRPNLEEYAESAIDLTILKNLSDRLGKHAQPVFQRYFLTPEIEEDKRAADLFSRLIRLDSSGIFVSIFLEELNSFGEYLYSTGDTGDKTDEVVSLAEYLLGVATRDVGERIQLEYISPCFKIGIMLLAISLRAETEGLPPYLGRIDKNIRIGCDSIYVASYPRAKSFLRRLVDALNADQRLVLVKWNSILPITSSFAGRGISEIVLFRRNYVFEDSTFLETVDTLRLEKGSVIKGTVFDISQTAALIEIGRGFGIVSLEDCSWHTQRDCQRRI